MSKKGIKRPIDCFFKAKVHVVQGRESPPDNTNKKEDVHDTHPRDQQDVNDNHTNESPRVEPEKDVHNLAAYIRLGPYQLSKQKYPFSPGGPNDHMRSFQEVWFKSFWWLEYSETKDVAYCLPCYFFNKKPVRRVGSDRFTKQGFNKWKKVNYGNDCAFITHVGKTSASAHNFSVRCYEALKNKLCHIKNFIKKQTKKEVIENRLRLKTTIESVKWLTVQTCGLRGSDERPGSKNQGNLLELECPYAYYVHCFAHQLQLALVSASKEVVEVHKFFKNLNIIVNVISSSCKRNDQLIDAQVAKIAHLAEIGELKTGKGQNQIQIFELTLLLRSNTTSYKKGDAAYCLEHLLSFDFVIGMHIMKEIMEITDKLCQALQHKSQDIINALALIRQLVELNSRFNESVIELLRLNVALDPRKSFNIDDIWLHETGKSKSYPLVDRLIRLILTLPVSTASSERAFSAMKIVQVESLHLSDDETEWHL
ncbi:zinc finger MYM-type protein 1-like protein [Tanacetum coccineum]